MKRLAVRYCGKLADLSSTERAALLMRGAAESEERVAERVRAIIGRVRRDGADALVQLTREFDGVAIDSFEVSREAQQSALDNTEPALVRALERAARNLETVHRAQLPVDLETESEPGVIVGRRAEPLAAVGIYAPGGRAAYPSSVLMGVVPARVAGVPDIVVCSPPGADGLPSQVVLAAARLAGATRVFALGGAQAIAAMAFGVAPVPRVMRIVGPGNAYVAEAKRQLAGSVAIDSPAGPSEILVIADASADPKQIARELLAQAEHDPDASVVALLLDESLVNAVCEALVEDPTQATLSSTRTALASRGAVLSVASIEEALMFCDQYAPEHLALQVVDADQILPRIRHAGTVFIGGASSVAFGDYMTGGNHVLPTAGAARAFSGLSILEFLRFSSYQRVSPEAARRMADDVALLATAEGLPAHAEAARGAGRIPS